jgi:hypothetical protein
MRLLRQARDAAAKRDVGSQAIIVNRSARALVIPAAGSAAGANGTFFRSDVTMANWNDTPQLIGLIWLPNGNPAGMSIGLTALPELSIVTERDFVSEVLEETGVGTIILLPLQADGQDLAPDAAIDAFSRIWTPQPNASGTVSQPFPAVEPSYLTNEEEGVILGLRQDAQYRTNVGIVNISDADLVFELSVLTENGAAPVVERITVPSLSMLQRPIPAGAFGQLSLGLTVENAPGDEFTWIAYASSTDNISGDGWVSIAANPWDDEQLDDVEPGQ